jgi:methylase of polypeptide subunit release factors
MTIQELNIILNNLSGNPSRDKVIDFAISLTEWMGLKVNADKRPQLLAPQTQKLKEYLVSAPQTVQPQLYRLTADGQNIRIRFAVLKKIKKEYINQLVDNDPGLGSYQAFTKGLVHAVNGTTFIPTQPYFIHFITTPEYDRLILIFNHGDQKRIVSFRDRLTNTQYNKIILQWQNIATKSKQEIANLFWDSLDIKEVNKEFYKQIKERFDALLGIVKLQHSEATDNQVKQFTVRLIGRYLFCWFLKEKGIISQNLIGKKAIQETENYYKKTLLKLFFKTLNTKIQDRNTIKNEKLFEKIPYLNGGLFDESEEDKLCRNLNLDTWLVPFVEILESYDFTVDESSSQYQQVAVDPEMLGRIFENLLASQNEETEKIANQRKAFGAFYTPREIVDYMVNESIKAHFVTTLQVSEEEIASLFTASPTWPDKLKNKKEQALQALENMKILDPACGSGAFPMGILHKLVELHEILGTVKSGYELKKDILSQNIYGVDIMPMAIEIARLRAWLSLVLEEDYKPNDSKHNFGVKPLPNLDFKFICANSLIELGLDAFIRASKGTLHEQFTENLINRLKGLEDLRRKFFIPALASSEKEKLKTAYFKNRSEVVDAINADSDKQLKGIAKKIKDWNPFDDSSAAPFFSPTWMFGIENGFDIVIGNPPYVQLQNNSGKLADLYAGEKYKTFARTGDIYALFYEKAFQLLHNKGVLAFITSNSWMRAAHGEALRKYFIDYTNPQQLINFGGYQVFDATVNTNILIAEKGPYQNKVNTCVLGKEDFSLNNMSDYFRQHRNVTSFNPDSSWVVLSSIEQSIKTKIDKAGIPLRDWNVNIYRGILTGFNDAFIIDCSTKDKLIKDSPNSAEIIRPILQGRDIKKYAAEFGDRWLIFTRRGINIDNYPAIKDYLHEYYSFLKPRKGNDTSGRKPGTYHWYEIQDNIAYYEDFKKEKIIWMELSDSPKFSYDIKQYLAQDTAFIMTGKNLKYLTAFLNSKLCDWYFDKITTTSGVGTNRWKKIYIENLPIPKIGEQQEKDFNKIVDQLLIDLNMKKDITNLDFKINELVLSLYDFTEEERELILNFRNQFHQDANTASISSVDRSNRSKAN